MRITKIGATLIFGGMLVLGACANPAAPTPITTPTPAPTPTPTLPATTPPVPTPSRLPSVKGPNEVWTTSDRIFSPGILTVAVGTTVVWLSKDSEPHTVTSDTGLFNGALGGGGSFNYTFTKPGDYEYYCSAHEGMNGAIHVQ